jgi:heme exporter protein A
MTLLIENISFERNFQNLFSAISMDVQPGECLQVNGANGSGKSTLLRMIAGYIEPLEGRILWKNQCIMKHRDDYQQQVHYVGHKNGIKSYLTVFENLKLFSALSNQTVTHQKIYTVLEKMHLRNLIDKQAHYLSAGQLRRLALTRLLLHSVPLWIVDEPTTALDKQGQQLFVDLLQQHLNQKGIAIVTTHHALSCSVNKTIQLGEYNA